MSKKIKILFITPFFLLFATTSCILFAKLDKEHRQQLAFDSKKEELIALKGLDDMSKEGIRDVMNKLAHSSSFSLSWNRKFGHSLKSVSADKVAGFDLMAFILLDSDLEKELFLVKNQKKQYGHLLRLLSDGLTKEYESVHFFDRARKFANSIGLEEELVLKVLKEGIESLKFDGDLSCIEALVDVLSEERQAKSQFSYSLL